MKIRLPLLLTGLLFFISGMINGQQWRPLTPGEKFNYRIDSAGYISNSIWVDSVRIENGDSVFFLNRVVTSCDTCSTWYTYTFWRLCNQHQFLEKKMIRKTGGLYVFQDPGKYNLKTIAPLNASWIFDSVANITAQIINIDQQLIFGVYDSVKTIYLSTGDTILLSKSHGILKFPDLTLGQHYHLEGIEGRNAGIAVPKFVDFFNFNSGDVFQYYYDSYNYGIQSGYGGLKKVTITSRDSSAGYYAYEATVISCNWPQYMGFHGDTAHFYEMDTLVFQDSATHFCNYYPLQIMENQVDIYFGGPNSTIMAITKDTNQMITKAFGGGNSENPLPAPYIHGNSQTPPLPYEVLVPAGYFYYIREYKTGLGLTKDNYMVFEATGDYELIGYIKNGDTTGLVYPDDVILETIPENDPGSRIKVFPNPANDKVSILFDETPKDPVRIELYSPEGSLILKEFSENHLKKVEINVNFLRRGIYYIRIYMNDRSFHKKLIIR